MGDRPGLAGAGAREDADRAVQGFGRRTLLRIESVEESFGVGHGSMVSGRTDTAGRAARNAPDRVFVPPGGAAGARKTHPMGWTTEVTAQITMYSTPWCGYCKRLKGQLDRAGIGYAEVDIEQNPSAASYVESVNHGNQTVPTVVFADGSAMTNPSLQQVQAKLAA